MRVSAVLLLGGGLLLGACLSLFGAPSAGGAPVEFNQDFTLKHGESADVGVEKVRVAFERLTGDSRCPRDVQCIQAGEASLVASVIPPGGGKAQVELKTTPGQTEAAAGAYTLKLTRLEPVPLSTRRTRPDEYRATFVLSRRP
jgi:hypothetical protein